jgi:hypothetical protein
MNKEIALNNLKQLDRIFRENNSEYWLSCGTLLGFYRDGDFIGHDTDTDICLNIDSLSTDCAPIPLASICAFCIAGDILGFAIFFIFLLHITIVIFTVYYILCCS